MPSIMTHYLLGERLFKYMQENYKNIEISKDSLLWGSQGPDFLFSYNTDEKINAVKDFGKRLHSAGGDQTLAFICNFAHRSKNKIDKGYALGFLSHFALDSIAHPYVLYGAKQLAQQSENMDEHLSHLLIESNLDIITLRYETGKVTNQLNLKKCAPKNDITNQHMATLYYMLGKSVFNQDMDMDCIYQATQDYRKKLRRLNDYTGFKRDLALRHEKRHHTPPLHSIRYRGLTEDDKYDYANISHKSWTDKSRIRTESFLELFEEAYKLTTALADVFIEGGDITGISQNRTLI
ncbi:MAG TPA: zinc dependent phospholipase C family protein [Clostridiales bacterium]|nr:zinc dependent phospholipase C family protein [Clostridiales bacterium]